MPSLIDFTKPIYGTPTTQSVRDNFHIAQVEITDLQNIVAEGPFVPLDGGEMTGLLTLAQDPITGDQAATKRYVDNIAFGGGSGGAPDAPKDGMFYARGGAATPTDGNDWTADPLFHSLLIGADKDTTLFGIRADATNNYFDFLTGGQNLLQFNRATKILDLRLNNTVVATFSDTAIAFNKLLTLSADPTTAMHAVTKQYVDAKPGGALIGDTLPAAAPGVLGWNSTDGQLYVRYNDGTSVQWVIANNISGLADVATKTESANNVGRNFIHNARFNIAQRGNGPFTAVGYNVDRWSLWRNLDTASIVREVMAMGGLANNEDGAYYITCAFTGVNDTASQTAIYQLIEDVRRLANKTVTVSFYALCWAGAIKVGVNLDQSFGSGGSPSAVVSVPGQTVTLDQTWKRYSLTFTMPSVVGKTLGTNNNHCTSFNLFLSSGNYDPIRTGNPGVQAGTVQIYGVQIEVGSVATTLEKLDPQVDLANCQRFYQTGWAWAYYSNCSIAQTVGNTYTFVIPMRATPTTSLNSPSNTNIGTLTANALGLSGVGIFGVVTANGSVGISVGYTVSADL